MRVKFTGTGQSGRLEFSKGDVADLPDKVAATLLATGLAVEQKETTKEVKQNVS